MSKCAANLGKPSVLHNSRCGPEDSLTSQLEILKDNAMNHGQWRPSSDLRSYRNGVAIGACPAV